MTTDGLGFTPGTGANIAVHVIAEDSEARVVERIAPGAGVVATWAWGTDASALTATGLSSIDVDTQGKGRIMVSARAAVAAVDVGDTFTFRLAYYAADDGLIGFSGDVAPEFTEYDDSTYQYSTVAVFANDLGAAAVGLYLIALPGTATTMDVVVKAL